MRLHPFAVAACIAAPLLTGACGNDLESRNAALEDRQMAYEKDSITSEKGDARPAKPAATTAPAAAEPDEQSETETVSARPEDLRDPAQGFAPVPLDDASGIAPEPIPATPPTAEPQPN